MKEANGTGMVCDCRPEESRLRLKSAAVLDRIARCSEDRITKPVEVDIREYRILIRTPTEMIVKSVKERYGIENE